MPANISSYTVYITKQEMRQRYKFTGVLFCDTYKKLLLSDLVK